MLLQNLALSTLPAAERRAMALLPLQYLMFVHTFWRFACVTKTTSLRHSIRYNTSQRCSRESAILKREAQNNDVPNCPIRTEL